MNYGLKNTISALAILIFCIMAYASWDVGNVRFAYLVIMCLVQIVINLLYLFFNRTTLSRRQALAELIGIAVYTAVAIVVALTQL